MHPLLARIPLLRRPFFQLELARRACERALAERDAAIEERDALKAHLQAVGPARAGPSVQRRCVFCRNEVEAWLPFQVRAREMSPFLIRLETVGSNVERFWCPHCSSFDRERHLRLCLDRLRMPDAMRGGSILHIAPEVRLRDYIQHWTPSLYVKGDLSPADESIERLDVHDLPFAAGTFAEASLVPQLIVAPVEEMDTAMTPPITGGVVSPTGGGGVGVGVGLGVGVGVGFAATV